MRNPNFNRLENSYLFTEIVKRKQQFLEKNPTVDLIALGIGDTTLSLPKVVVQAMQEKAEELGTNEGYSGYEEFQGREQLRSLIAEKLYKNRISADEITISDGAKCDIGRLQWLFGENLSIGIQDPTYPAYVDVSLIAGKGKINFLPCTPQNGFFPEIPAVQLLYICSPNNPTGTVLTKAQLSHLVETARQNHTIILFDSAYAGFIQRNDLPRSIYEIPGAEEVAIEIGSFSKLIGFTGVRLGWTIVPKKLKYPDGTSVKADWDRICVTFFNGASNLAQVGGIAALSDEGMDEIQKRASYYLENARILRTAFDNFACYGGENAPYLWIDLKGQNSFEVFDSLMEKAHLITTPGSGFGHNGEGFLRVSAFGDREKIKLAAKKLYKILTKI